MLKRLQITPEEEEAIGKFVQNRLDEKDLVSRVQLFDVTLAHF